MLSIGLLKTAYPSIADILKGGLSVLDKIFSDVIRPIALSGLIYSTPILYLNLFNN